MREHNGHRWETTQLGDDSFSVICVDPAIGDDGTDYTSWPDNDVVSEWVGCDVEFLDSGDDPIHPEGIYEKREG